MQLVTHLMFQNGKAAEAAEFYATLADDAELTRTPVPGGGETLRVRLAGHELLVFESPMQHDFDMTPAVSLMVEVDTPEEVDGLFERLADGGEVFMPVDDYGFSPRYGWCRDRFGMSWQIGARA